jgi:hypothetical protein
VRAAEKFVFFSIIQLLTQVLQRDTAARKMIMQASDDWKTGRYWQGEPEVISDFMHGSRFANSWMARKAAPGEERVIRIQLIGWDDEATVSNINPSTALHARSPSCLLTHPHACSPTLAFNARMCADSE